MLFYKLFFYSGTIACLKAILLATTYLRERVLRLYIAINPFQAADNIDKQISVLCPDLLSRETFYLEAGANNGWKRSNTYFLEHLYGAHGFLIEPSPSAFSELLIRRSNRNIFINSCLVSSDYQEDTVEMFYSDLMTCISDPDKLESDFCPKTHSIIGQKYFYGGTFSFHSPVTTLTSLCLMHHVYRIDLLSLDLEGSELFALQGIDFNKIDIKYILLETKCIDPILHFLSQHRYSLLKQISPVDFLFSLQ